MGHRCYCVGPALIPVVGFYNQDSQEGGKRFPYCSSCALLLFLPRGFEDPGKFEAMMMESVFGFCGFDKS